jgi:CheY-like chemotaxis protein/anti-sigma regulatory factor (Ser/Thr protein kinase)
MPTVLVVDDSAVDRVLAGRLLQKSSNNSVVFAVDGADALKKIEEHHPDMVVTDLQMPNINGLELVETIRDKYPLIPVILMTAHGSEDVAVQALLSGAASYVPKTELARYLLETVENVLNVAKTNQQQRRLMDGLDCRRIAYTLDNDSALVPPLVDQVQQLLASMDVVDDPARVQVGIALEEALYNALYHGNLELTNDEIEESRMSLLEPGARNPVAERAAQAPYRDRKLFFEVAITRDEARFTIRDSGRGFRPADVPDVNNPATMHDQRGRGLVLMRTLMDDVIRDPKGNEVCLVKRRRSAAAR